MTPEQAEKMRKIMGQHFAPKRGMTGVEERAIDSVEGRNPAGIEDNPGLKKQAEGFKAQLEELNKRMQEGKTPGLSELREKTEPYEKKLDEGMGRIFKDDFPTELPQKAADDNKPRQEIIEKDLTLDTPSGPNLRHKEEVGGRKEINDGAEKVWNFLSGNSKKEEELPLKMSSSEIAPKEAPGETPWYKDKDKLGMLAATMGPAVLGLIMSRVNMGDDMSEAWGIAGAKGSMAGLKTWQEVEKQDRKMKLELKKLAAKTQDDKLKRKYQSLGLLSDRITQLQNDYKIAVASKDKDQGRILDQIKETRTQFNYIMDQVRKNEEFAWEKEKFGKEQGLKERKFALEKTMGDPYVSAFKSQTGKEDAKWVSGFQERVPILVADLKQFDEVLNTLDKGEFKSTPWQALIEDSRLESTFQAEAQRLSLLAKAPFFKQIKQFFGGQPSVKEFEALTKTAWIAGAPVKDNYQRVVRARQALKNILSDGTTRYDKINKRTGGQLKSVPRYEGRQEKPKESVDPNIQKYSEEHSMSYEKAKELLIKRGYKGK